MNSDKLTAAFDRLMRGIAHDSAKRIYSGYHELYRFGPAAIPELERRIFEADWKTPTRPEATRMQSALVSLLHDIDEARSRDVIDRLLEGDCHPAMRGILNSIRRYDENNFRVYDIHELRVLVAREIDESEDVPIHMECWLDNVPPEDLKGIERLYVIRRPPKMDFAGWYMPVLSTITVIWKDPLLHEKLFAWINRVAMERTLYHEIGHHFHGHTFGQQPEQEKEANRYADARLRITHPYLIGIVKVLQRILPRQPTRY